MCFILLNLVHFICPFLSTPYLSSPICQICQNCVSCGFLVLISQERVVFWNGIVTKGRICFPFDLHTLASKSHLCGFLSTFFVKIKLTFSEATADDILHPKKLTLCPKIYIMMSNIQKCIKSDEKQHIETKVKNHKNEKKNQLRNGCLV